MAFAFEDRQNIADVVQRRKKTFAQIKGLRLKTAFPGRLLRHCSQTTAECFIHQALEGRVALLLQPLEQHGDVFIDGEGCAIIRSYVYDVLMSRSCAFSG